MATVSGSSVLRTAYRAPREHAACERFRGSAWRTCPDHVLVPGEAHLRRALREYVANVNTDRPHQSLLQRLPVGAAEPMPHPEIGRTVHVVPVLGGLHHPYPRAAQTPVTGARMSQPARTRECQTAG